MEFTLVLAATSALAVLFEAQKGRNDGEIIQQLPSNERGEGLCSERISFGINILMFGETVVWPGSLGPTPQFDRKQNLRMSISRFMGIHKILFGSLSPDHRIVLAPTEWMIRTWKCSFDCGINSISFSEKPWKLNYYCAAGCPRCPDVLSWCALWLQLGFSYKGNWRKTKHRGRQMTGELR